MIRLRVACLRALLTLALLSPGSVALAGGIVSLDAEVMRLQRRLQDLPTDQTVKQLRQQILDLQNELRRLEFMAKYLDGYEVDLDKVMDLRRQLARAQQTRVNFQQAISGSQRERFFPGVRHRLAAFTFDDPHATGLGDPISFLVAKKLLFSARVASFAIVNYRQGADHDPSSNLAYFDKVDAITKDQNFSLAIWGRITRTERGVRIDSFLQVPDDNEKSAYVRTVGLPADMGGGTLTAHLKPDRLLVQSLDVDQDKIDLFRTAAEQVATLRASPSAAAPVTGRFSERRDATGRIYDYSIIGSERDWVQLRLSDGISGWTSVDQFCIGICRALLDVADFTNDVVALTSGLTVLHFSYHITREAQAMLEQLRALVFLPNNPNRAIEIAERWARAGSSRGALPSSPGFANLLAVARVNAELSKQRNFDQIRLRRQAVDQIANQLAEASIADPRDTDIVENLAVLFAYLGDDKRRDLALEIAAKLKAKAH